MGDPPNPIPVPSLLSWSPTPALPVFSLLPAPFTSDFSWLLFPFPIGLVQGQGPFPAVRERIFGMGTLPVPSLLSQSHSCLAHPVSALEGHRITGITGNTGITRITGMTRNTGIVGITGIAGITRIMGAGSRSGRCFRRGLGGGGHRVPGGHRVRSAAPPARAGPCTPGAEPAAGLGLEAQFLWDLGSGLSCDWGFPVSGIRAFLGSGLSQDWVQSSRGFPGIWDQSFPGIWIGAFLGFAVRAFLGLGSGFSQD